MNIKYQHVENAHSGFQSHLEDLIMKSGARRICELGGGAYPALDRDFIAKHRLDYTVLDISAEELDKAPDGYHTIVADIAAKDFTPHADNFDLVFSKMLAEHVKDGKTFHQNVRKLLAGDGMAFHFFPTLFALPLVVNRLLPETLSRWLLLAFHSYRHKNKFPAYYHWCLGPMGLQIDRFEGLGYRVDEYIGFFGHDYYEKIPFINTMQDALSRYLVKRPVPCLTSCAYLRLKPKQ